MSYQDDNYRDNPTDSRDDRDRYDDRYQDDRDRDDRQRATYPGQPPNRGCSKGCLYGFAGCGCLSLITMVIIGVAGWRFVDAVVKGTTQDPKLIQAATAEMADIAVPPGLEPKLKTDLLFAKVILYQSRDSKSALTLVQLNPQFAPKNPGEDGEFRKGFRKGLGNGDDDDKLQKMTIEKTEVKDITIRGKVCKINFSEAKSGSGEAYQIVEGEFAGKTGTVELRYLQPAADYDEAEMIKFLESIR